MEQKRIEWVDIYRGILIILMVIGHSTGLFNKYIYQFHMAAFFFLSGYTTKPKNRSLFRLAYNKFFSILLPALFSVLLGLVVLWYFHLRNYDVLLSTWLFPGWKIALESFFTQGAIYVDVLGANWFLLVLFGVYILNGVITHLFEKNIFALTISTIFFYAIGYCLIWFDKPLHIGMFQLNLIFIGHFYYFLGYLSCICKIFDRISSNKVIWILFFFISLGGIGLVGNYLHITVDWASAKFTNPVSDTLVAINGIIFIYTTSLFWNCLGRKFKNILIYVGRNSIGILLLHFSFFKVIYIPFYLSGLISRDDIACIVPGHMSNDIIANKYWIFVSTGSIILSLAVWELSLHSKTLKFLLGKDNTTYQSIYNTLSNTKIFLAIKKVTIDLNYKYFEFKKNISIMFKNNCSFYTIVLLLLLFILVPLYKQAIMCNDELQARFWSMKGFADFYSHYAKAYAATGRVFSIIIDPLTMYLGFIGPSNWFFKIIQILSILLDAGLFAVFLKKLLGSKSFAVLCGLSIIVFLPITFEHTAPNAFNTLFNIPFAFLFISLILFINYLESGKKFALGVSMFLLFINLLSYESFIMLLPLYGAIVIKQLGINNKTKIIKKCLFPTIVAVAFFILYIISGILFKSYYEGNTIGEFSWKSSLKIIFQLFQVSFPGYYIFTPKYQYLSQYYNDLRIENYIRILLSGMFFGIIVYYLIKKENRDKTKAKNFWIILGCGILCIILPTLPISIAKMYQGNINANGFMALPTTFFCYFGATFVCWFVLWKLVHRLQGKGIALFIAIGAAIYMVPVQIMNDIIAEQQYKDFNELTIMESLISTELVHLLDGKEFFSTDFFKTRNTLAIHDSYWYDFADMVDARIKITNSSGTIENGRIYFNGSDFAIWYQKGACIVTQVPKEGYGIYQYTEDAYKVISYQNPVHDNNFYEYYYILSDSNILTPVNREDFLLELVGSTLNDCQKVYGYYDDGWVGRSSQFVIQTKDEGKIDIEIYCPLDDFSNSEMTIYINDSLYNTIKIQEVGQKIMVNTEPNQKIRLGLEFNFAQENTGQDSRELATIISSLQGR